MDKKELNDVPQQNQGDEDWDSWNPMADAYHDVSFNTYNKGPGASLPVELQPVYMNGGNSSQLSSSQSSSSSSSSVGDNDPLTLFIRKVPEGLTESGVRNMLLTCGITPRAVRIVRYASKTSDLKAMNMGFIEFKTQEQAKIALANLQNRPPWFLNLKFAATRQGSLARKDQSELQP